MFASRNLGTSIACRQLSTSSAARSQEQIVIPKRIPRSNTDILAALSNTVGRDYTAFAYKYHDDPYLLPRSNMDKRSFALAKESGRNAARYFLDKYPHLFYRNDAEPKVEAFHFKEMYSPEMTFDLQDLNIAITKREVTNAMIAYKALVEQQKQTIDVVTRLNLFKLISFYNHQDPIDCDLSVEANWFKRYQQMKKSWKDNELADQLFAELEPIEPQMVTSVYIQALVLHGHMNKALDIFNKYLDQKNGKSLDVGAFNAIIRTIVYVRDSGESRQELLHTVLSTMSKLNVHPNLETFNRVLEVLARNSYRKGTINEVKKVLNEMKELNVRPSLATYYYVLRCFYPEKKYSNLTLNKIMDAIKDTSFVYTEPDDLRFFERAMAVCEENLQDVDMAIQINSLFEKGANHKLVISSFSESIYYRHFFLVLCKGAKVEQMMDFYTKYVPTVYNPEIAVYCEILDMLAMYEAYEYIPQIWTDLVEFDLSRKEVLIDKLSSVMAKCQSEEKLLQDAFGLIAKEIMKRYQAALSDERQTMNMDVKAASQVYNNCIVVFDRNNQFDHVLDVLRLIDRNESFVAEVQSDLHNTQLLNRTAEHLIKTTAYEKLVFLLNHTAKRNLNEVHQFVSTRLADASFKEHQRQYLDSLIAEALPSTN